MSKFVALFAICSSCVCLTGTSFGAVCDIPDEMKSLTVTFADKLEDCGYTYKKADGEFGGKTRDSFDCLVKKYTKDWRDEWFIKSDTGCYFSLVKAVTVSTLTVSYKPSETVRPPYNVAVSLSDDERGGDEHAEKTTIDELVLDLPSVSLEICPSSLNIGKIRSGRDEGTLVGIRVHGRLDKFSLGTDEFGSGMYFATKDGLTPYSMRKLTEFIQSSPKRLADQEASKLESLQLALDAGSSRDSEILSWMKFINVDVQESTMGPRLGKESLRVGLTNYARSVVPGMATAAAQPVIDARVSKILMEFSDKEFVLASEVSKKLKEFNYFTFLSSLQRNGGVGEQFLKLAITKGLINSEGKLDCPDHVFAVSNGDVKDLCRNGFIDWATEKAKAKGNK